MPDARELERGWVEDHRFFPEWADRPPSTESLHEADRYSYLAGGYAEEFGHGVQQAISAAHSPPAEEDSEWCVQIGGLHPGYPECPRPRDRNLPAEPLGATAALRSGWPVGVLHRRVAEFKVIMVGRRSADKRHAGAIPGSLARLAKALWIRRHKLPLS